MGGNRLKHAAHLGMLRTYRALPTKARRVVVRLASPTHTVGAICVILNESGDQVLLVAQAYRARWGLPGGLLKRREAADVAARREVREEVGVDVVLDGDPAIVVEPEAQRVDLIFVARLAGGQPEPHPTSAEIIEARWFPVAELPPLQHETALGIAALHRGGKLPSSFGPALANIAESRVAGSVISGS